ncbi:MAG TPA: hypothetical protein VIK52_10955, partial [Opitutaceae bacterium]
LVLGGLVLLGGLLAGGSGLAQGARQFIAKGSSGEMGVLEAYRESRGGLMEISLANFRANPVFGIGFGRNSWEAQGYANQNSDGGLLSLAFAPTEKGQIATAVLEETGIIGFLAFLLMIGAFVLFFSRQANVYGLGMFVCALGLNMGEMNLFSMGGLGMLEWLFIAFAGMLADRCSDPVMQQGYRVR